MITMILIGLALFLMFVSTVLYFRNKHVFELQTEWNHKVYAYHTKLIQKGKYEFLEKYSYDDYMNAIWSYYKMLWRIDVWGLDKMVNNSYLYDVVRESE